MALTTQEQAAYGKLWNLIAALAPRRSESGGYEWSSGLILRAANQQAREFGQPLTFQENTAALKLISMARSMDRAAGNLTAAAPDTAIDSSMIADWPTAAGPAVQAAAPAYMAKAQFTYTDTLGQQQTAWITVTGITQLPDTAGALALRLTGAAIQAYTTPSQEGGNYLEAEMMSEFGSITSMQLYAV